jgi:hypothetical protein
MLRVLKQKRNSASASSDVARLDECRIMIVSELEKGAHVQESFLKSITEMTLSLRAVYGRERRNSVLKRSPGSRQITASDSIRQTPAIRDDI